MHAYIDVHTLRHVCTYPSICKHVFVNRRQNNHSPPVGQNRPIVQPSHGQRSCSQGRTATDHPQSPCSKRRQHQMIDAADSQPYRKTETLGISGWASHKAEDIALPVSCLHKQWWCWCFCGIHFTQVDGEFYFHALCLSQKPNSYRVYAVLGTNNSVLTTCCIRWGICH